MGKRRVVAFSGHMVDAPGRIPSRFPSEKVDAVRLAIREQLERLNVVYGFSSAARGSDLLFIEELLARGGRASVYLPFPPEAFKRTSVGYGWDERFDTLLKHERVEVIQLAEHAPSEEKEPEAYEVCNRRVLKDAKGKAILLDAEPVLLTVWNGNPGDGAGGTADAVRNWRNEGHEVDIIDISKLGNYKESEA